MSMVEFEQVATCWKWHFKLLYLYVDHCHTQHGYNSYHSLEKSKKTLRKTFSETNFIEQDSSKNRLALVNKEMLYSWTGQEKFNIHFLTAIGKT